MRFTGRLTVGIAENVELVRERIRSACLRSGRNPEDVVLLAASKTRTPEEIREAFEAGVKVFGENRVQEAVAKVEALRDIPVEWHMVGHLQRNKARHAVKIFELIHSVDDEELAVEVNRRASSIGKVQRVLIQVKLSEEKFGCPPELLEKLVSTVLELENLRLEGLMVIPPYPENPEDSRPYFSKLRELKEEVESRFGVRLPHLSMGMTNDFEVAIEEGATIVRIGTAIFGMRNYP